MEFDTTSQRMLGEHAPGLGYCVLGARHGMSHETAARSSCAKAAGSSNKQESAAVP
jgi:hypothetical protein